MTGNGLLQIALYFVVIKESPKATSEPAPPGPTATGPGQATGVGPTLPSTGSGGPRLAPDNRTRDTTGLVLTDHRTDGDNVVVAPGNDDPVLRWNACVRYLDGHRELSPAADEEPTPIVSE